MEEIAETRATEISISVVSHAQIGLINNLLRDIEEYCLDSSLELILTLNLNETLPFCLDSFSFPIRVVRNATPKGFAANHNQAFTHTIGRYFCVMNPDIRLNNNPFHMLLACLKDQSVGVVAPFVSGESGEIEDSARRFPTPLKILCKAIGGCKGGDYVVNGEPIYPDWVGGMFMLFPRDIFKQLGGFNERYFLYYEDVDLCARLRLRGYEVMACPDVKVIHEARRDSHHRFKYLKLHLASMIRFFLSAIFMQIWWRKLTRRAK